MRVSVGTISSVSGTTGTGAAGLVAYWSGVSQLTSDSAFTFDGTTMSAKGLIARNDTNGATRIQIRNDDAGASAFTQLKLTTDAGDFNINANSTAAGDSVQLTADSTFGGGMSVGILGANPLSLSTNSTVGYLLSGSGKSTIGASGGTQFHDVNGRGFNITYPSSGTSMFIQLNHTSNTAASGACFYALVAGTSGGDAWSQYGVSGSTEWAVGLDISDDRCYVISGSGTLGNNNVIRCDRNSLVANIPNGVRTKYSTANTSSPPTAGELTSAFGTPSDLGSGYIGVLNDNGSGTAEYIVWTDATNWFYAAGTKAV